MIKVLVYKNSQNTNNSVFETQELATEWINLQVESNSWGKPERWVREDQLVWQGLDINNALESRIELTPGEIEVTSYKFAAEYSVEIIDISSEIAAKKKISDRAKKRAFGEALIDKISVMNDGKNLSIAQVDAFMSEALVSNLREHLWAGNIDTFISKLEAGDVSSFFSTEEKNAVISECQQFLASL
jgi:hypothetical protein